MSVEVAPGAVTSSNAAAIRVIKRARLGDLKAQTQLGWMYAKGVGVPQDYFESAKWYYRAATRGSGRAQLELGLMYNKGQGVPRDYVLAEMWLNLSAAHAVGDTHDFAARLRDAVASKMTPKQLAASQELAHSWSKAR